MKLLLSPKYKIGDSVEINFNQLDFNKKSVRRRIIDNVMEEWSKNTYNNLSLFIRGRMCESSSKKSLKVLTNIIKGKNICELSIFKRHQESKDWFKGIIEILNTVEGATIIGVKACYHHLSNICPSNNLYLDKPFYKYNVIIFGKIGNNNCSFQTTLLEPHINLAKQ